MKVSNTILSDNFCGVIVVYGLDFPLLGNIFTGQEIPLKDKIFEYWKKCVDKLIINVLARIF